MLTALWGSAFMFNELALAAFTPAVLVAGRIVIAAALVVGYLRLAGDTLPRPGRSWVPMIVLALFGNVLPFHLVAWGQQHINSSLAGVLMAVMPLFVLTLAHFFVPGARLTPSRGVGFVVGFAGVIVIIGPDFINGFDGNLALLGALAVLGAALSYSVSTIYARRLGQGDPLRRSAGMLIVASLLSLPTAIIDLPSMAVPGVAAMVSLGVLGLLATGFATLLYFRLVQGPGPTFITFVNYLVPAWAVVAGSVVLDETLTSTTYFGLALILGGIAVSELGGRIAKIVAQSLRLADYANRSERAVSVIKTIEG